MALDKAKEVMYAVYSMIRTQLYFPEELYLELKNLAERERKSLAELVRLFVRLGISRQQRAKNPAKVFLKIASYASKGPKDLSQNLDKYLYGKKSLKYASSK